MEDVAGNLPQWAQTASAVIIALGVAITGIIRYIKTEPKAPSAPSGTAEVVTASFTDSRLLKELIEALREHAYETGRDSQKLQRNMDEVREAVEDNTKAVILQTDTSTNLIRFITREK